jgi:hypothetical protein
MAETALISSHMDEAAAFLRLWGAGAVERLYSNAVCLSEEELSASHPLGL